MDYEYVSYDELYKAYLNCRKRKRNTNNALEFEINLTSNLTALWRDLNNHTYTIGRSIAFCVDKPVKREVFAADYRDRLVHHLLMGRLNDAFEDEFIDDTYSCRVGKGTNYGVERCTQFIKEASENYTKGCNIIKGDLKSFIMTIDKKRLYDKLCKFVDEKYYTGDDRDVEFVKWLIGLIVFNEPQKNCIRKQPISHWKGLPKEKSLFSCDPGKGIPIGNLTSQVFANFYLSEFDHYVKEELGIQYYGRYVDDFFILVKDKEQITPTVESCRKKLSSMGVIMHPKKLYIQSYEHGVKFIGAVIKPNRNYIGNRTKGNMWEALREFSKELDEILGKGEEPTEEDIRHYTGSINSYLGFMKHYNTFNIRKKMLLSPFMKKLYNYCYIDENFTKLTPFKDYVKGSKRKKRFYKRAYYKGGEFSKLLDKLKDKNGQLPPLTELPFPLN